MKRIILTAAVVAALTTACSSSDKSADTVDADTVALAVDTVATAPEVASEALTDTVPAAPEKTEEELRLEQERAQAGTLLDDLESLVDKYASLQKKAHAGDLTAIERAASVMGEISRLQTSLEELKGSLTPDQQARFSSLVERVKAATL